MTVGELKKQLENISDDMVVVRPSGDLGFNPVLHVWTTPAIEIDYGSQRGYDAIHVKPHHPKSKEVRVMAIE